MGKITRALSETPAQATALERAKAEARELVRARLDEEIEAAQEYVNALRRLRAQA